MNATSRIGILGGSFDPVHWGHILLAREALRLADLDFVLLLVAKDPPHKMTQASPADRLRMARLAAEGEAGIYACDLELKLPGKSYAVDTMRELKRHFPDAELFYLLGSDVLATLPYWHGSEELVSLVKILCVARQDIWGLEPEGILKMQEQQKIPVRIIRAHIPNISSTEIRSCLRKGLPVSPYVPAPVEKYILDNGLYRQHVTISEAGRKAADKPIPQK